MNNNRIQADWNNSKRHAQTTDWVFGPWSTIRKHTFFFLFFSSDRLFRVHAERPYSESFCPNKCKIIYPNANHHNVRRPGWLTKRHLNGCPHFSHSTILLSSRELCLEKPWLPVRLLCDDVTTVSSPFFFTNHQTQSKHCAHNKQSACRPKEAIN